MEEGEGDGRWILREEGGEVDFVSGVVVVDDLGIERRERGNTSFFFTPVTLLANLCFIVVDHALLNGLYMSVNVPIEFFFPVLLRFYNPFPAHTKLPVTSVILQILVGLFRYWAKLQECLEILKLLILDTKFEWCWLLLCTYWHNSKRLG
jgi:hypothetical protein